MTAFQDQLQASLGDAYAITRELGGGGMSRVFLATERAHNRTVVIKVLPAETAGTVSVERFRREIDVAARLQQANIVPVLASGDVGGVPYFTMPYVAGESLRARLASGGELPITETVSILKEVGRALAYAHDHGVVHRDIKPDNVLLSGGTAMVTDFGIAKAMSAATTSGDGGLTATGVSLGTPAYMSPEQASGDPRTDHRADIYAFGCMAFELLTGSPPFSARTAQGVIAAHLTEAPPRVTERRASVPTPLASLVERCLAKNPADRPQRATELLAALDQPMTPPGGTEHGVTVTRRIPVVAIVSVLALIGVVFAALSLNRKSSSRAAVFRSIAILPMENSGGDASQEYFAVGISEDIASALVGSGVRVMPMTSALSPLLHEPGVTTDSMFRLLGVDAIVTGKASRLSNRLRVTVSLQSKDSLMWSHAYDQSAGDLLVLQHAITDSVADAVRGAIHAAKPGIAQDVGDPRALELASQGWGYVRQGTIPATRRAIELFTDALKLDPRNLRALTGLGWAWSQIGDGVAPPANVYDTVHAIALRMVALDSTSAETWASLAVLGGQWKWDWLDVERNIARARRIDPHHPYVYWAESEYQIAHGQADSAIRSIRAASALMPLDPTISMLVEMTYVASGKYDSVIVQSRRTQRLTPGFVYMEAFPGYALGQLGRYAEADSAFRYSERILGHRSPGLAWLRARQGHKAEAVAILDEIARDWKTKYVPPELIAYAYVELGDKKNGCTWLERGVDAQSFVAIFNKTSHMLDPMRGEECYQTVMRRMNLGS